MNNTKMSNVHRGFTLIELIIVIGVIAILSAGVIAILDPQSQLQKANDTRRKSDLSQLQKVLEQYYQDNGRYPGSDGEYRIIRLDGASIPWGGLWPPYMDVLPKEQSSTRRYVYYSTADGQAYYLYASLERGTKDPQACGNGICSSLGQYGFPPASACQQTCNYGVTSANVSP